MICPFEQIVEQGYLHGRQALKPLQRLIIPLPGLAIYDAVRPQYTGVRHPKRAPGIETDIGFPRYQRIVGKTGIQPGITHHKGP